jgi:hypothetical protein
MSDRTAARRHPFTVGLSALALACLFVVSQLSEVGWDATHFSAFGEEAPEIRAYAEERLGTVILRPQLGHDGRFFFVQANDPWILDPEENAYILDRPLYRSQRMFYPAVAGGFGLFEPEAIVWGMLITNLVAMGLGAWAVAWIATTMGGTAWWGLAFLFNLGFISELDVGGAGIVSGAAAFSAVALLMTGRRWAGVALLTLAALSREVMLVVAAGVALFTWRRGDKRDAVVAVLVPLGAVALWAVYLRMRIGIEPGLAEVEEVGIPFVGLVQAFEAWLGDPLDLVVGVAVVFMLVLYVRRARLHNDMISWGFLGFVPLTVLLTEQVWHSYFDITRAVAPLLTAFVLLVAVGDDGSGKVASESMLSEGT